MYLAKFHGMNWKYLQNVKRQPLYPCFWYVFDKHGTQDSVQNNKAKFNLKRGNFNGLRYCDMCARKTRQNQGFKAILIT